MSRKQTAINEATQNAFWARETHLARFENSLFHEETP
jgi:hypothetical protein